MNECWVGQREPLQLFVVAYHWVVANGINEKKRMDDDGSQFRLQRKSTTTTITW